ncbi:DUF397 domain-containing protein [Embleya sp. NBC_00896]|uniref:DUF397 domain-containing protein n=1 Tax=Embleya sp. NBC_00896 TaxID=2975961 RepID=UPI003870B987|nr:DUF397 domain-containing protein [Embleya sp. NBC_00896]
MTRERKADLYARDLSGVVWRCAPGSDPGDRIEVAEIPGGGMALRNPADPAGAIQRYDKREWRAFMSGVRGGEFDPEG